MAKLSYDDVTLVQRCRERAAASLNRAVSRDDIYDIFTSLIPEYIEIAVRQGRFDDFNGHIVNAVIPGLVVLVEHHGIKVED